MDKVIDFINVNRERYLEELKALLAIPSISALPEHAGDVKRCARVVRRRDAAHRPRERAGSIDTPGNPVVYGDWLRRARRADDSVLRPLRRAAGRSAGPLGDAAVRGDGPRRRDLRARLGRRQGPGVHAPQGDRGAPEAEPASCRSTSSSSSRARRKSAAINLDDFVRAHKAELDADVVVISDSPMFARGVPSICYSLRGLVYFQIDLRGSSTDLHSGSFGGAVANPAFVLAQMLAQMKDRGGRIKIPGFYDDVRAAAGGRAEGVGDAAVQREAVPQGLRHPEAVRRDRLHDARAHVGAADVRSQRPALRLHRRGRQDRAAGGGDGEGQHAPRAESGSGQDRGAVRGVPEEDRAEDGRGEGDAHARRQAVDDRRTTTPTSRRPAAPSRRGSDRQPVFTREGGSIPVVSTFQEELGLPSVLFGVGLPDENAHAPNEKLDLGNFHNGIISSAILYDEISKTR